MHAHTHTLSVETLHPCALSEQSKGEGGTRGQALRCQESPAEEGEGGGGRGVLQLPASGPGAASSLFLLTLAHLESQQGLPQAGVWAGGEDGESQPLPPTPQKRPSGEELGVGALVEEEVL